MNYRYTVKIERFQATSQVSLDDLRGNVPMGAAPQRYIFGRYRMLEYIDSNLKMPDFLVKYNTGLCALTFINRS